MWYVDVYYEDGTEACMGPFKSQEEAIEASYIDGVIDCYVWLEGEYNYL